MFKFGLAGSGLKVTPFFRFNFSTIFILASFSTFFSESLISAMFVSLLGCWERLVFCDSSLSEQGALEIGEFSGTFKIPGLHPFPLLHSSASASAISVSDSSKITSSIKFEDFLLGNLLRYLLAYLCLTNSFNSLWISTSSFSVISVVGVSEKYGRILSIFVTF